MVLFVNACVRKNSRTKRLADYLLSKIGEPLDEVRLSEVRFPIADEEFIVQRGKYVEIADFSHPMFDLAHQFAEADQIVIAAPFWDLSFPASLKQYFEQICVVGITFRYTPEGIPEGLCKAKKLYYVTTAGGDYFPEGYGFGYVKELARTFYGIPEIELIKAVGLDLDGANVEQIMRDCLDSIY